MGKHTVVIEFAGEEPAYSANMELLGGRVVAVAFADELERAEALESQRDDLLEALELADAALSGANMNMNVVERKVKAAIDRARGEA